MPNPHSHLASAVIRFRSELQCSLNENDGTPFYAVEDPVTGKFYRMGVRERRFMGHLDGHRTLEEAIKSMERDGRGPAVSLEEAETIAQSTVASGLAVPVGDSQKGFPSCRSLSAWSPLAKVNPFSLNIPLVNPDGWVSAAFPWCGWLVNRAALAVWIAVVFWGGYCIVDQWARFTQSATVYLAPHTWVYLWAVWCLLKVVHEFFHGLVCKKYGGYVGTAGLVLILFSPLAYVDVTSAWQLRSKWRRIYISAAGIYVEMFLAALAAIIWSRTTTGTVSQLCHSVIFTAGLTTILFNANPLMRFDGYYILSDLLGIQNLYGAGRQYVRSRLRYVFLGLPTTTESETQGFRAWAIPTYGVLAALWRVMVCLSLILVATKLFHGAGLVIALLGVVLWVSLPVVRLGRLLFSPRANRQHSVLRFSVLTSLILAVTSAVLWLPWPGGVSAPAIVAWAPEEVVRAASSGFVARVHVAAVRPVVGGQVLITLRNDQLRAELEDARLQVAQTKINSRILLSDENRHAEYQAELETLAAHKKRQAHLQTKVDGLTVRAPMAGRVIGGRPDELVGRYVEVGSPLMKIASESHKEIQIEIPEKYYDAFTQNVENVLNVRVKGYPGKIQHGRLARVEPRATVVLRNPLLGSSSGGPLALKASSVGVGERSDTGSRVELIAPRFRGVIALPDEESRDLRAGQTARVRLFDFNETLGRRAYRVAESWVRQKLNGHGAENR